MTHTIHVNLRTRIETKYFLLKQKYSKKKYWQLITLALNSETLLLVSLVTINPSKQTSVLTEEMVSY